MTLRWRILITLLAIGLVGALQANTQPGNPFRSSAPDYPGWSAFSAIAWKDDRPQVEFEGQWWELEKFHDIPSEEIVRFCRENYSDRWQKRFEEDLVMVVRLIGHTINRTTTLGLRRAGEQRIVRNVRMNEENLRAIKIARQVRADAIRRSPHALSAQAVQDDLDAFQKALEERFAYLEANGAAYVEAIESLRVRSRQGMSTGELALGLREVLALFIDGHATVSGPSPTAGFLPFLVEPTAGRFVAFVPDRSAFLDAEHPYISHIDRRPISEWLVAAARLLPQGSPQYIERHGLRTLRRIQFLRDRMGLEQGDTVDLKLASRDGTNTQALTLEVSGKFPTYKLWPRPALEPQVLDGNIGYLRLARMDSAAVETIRTWMPRFRETAGLIVDVRNNGGGSRDALREFFPYFMGSDDPPHIANVAAYRLAAAFHQDHLDARYAYPPNSPRWSEDEREAIRRFQKSFLPSWIPPRAKLSEWHYMVLSRDQNDGRFTYDKPVVILLDSKCFSATDIFLGAFKGWRNATLIGTASGGGSAFSQPFRLENSRLMVKVASMASFQPTGKLYDGYGVQPDVLVEPPPEYFLTGGSDVFLDRAIELLRSPSQP